MQYQEESISGFRLTAEHDDGLKTHVLGVPADDGWLVLAAQNEEMEMVGAEAIGWAANRGGAMKRAEKFASDYEPDESGSGMLSRLDEMGKGMLGQ